MVLKKSPTCDSDDIVVATVDVINNDLAVALASLDLKKGDLENGEPLFKTVDIPGKGQGTIATKKIYPGDILYAEKPVLTIPEHIFDNVEDCEDFVEKEVNKMSSSDRELLLNLTDCRTNNEQYVGMIYTNAMNFEGDSVVCPIIARANHSCRPNAEFVPRKDLGKMLLVAMYVIEEGEEICINYLPIAEEGADIHEVRQETLLRFWGFRCCCIVCTLQGDELEKEEKVRENIKELQAAGIENLDISELEDLIGLVYQVNGKLSYILDLIESLYRRGIEGSLRRLEYAVSGFTLSVCIHGEGSLQTTQWKQNVDYEKYFLTVST